VRLWTGGTGFKSTRSFKPRTKLFWSMKKMKSCEAGDHQLKESTHGLLAVQPAARESKESYE
jgi:hypothetical protein